MAPGRIQTALEAMARDGDIGPFLALIFTRVIRKLSNRDLIRLDEKTMKVVLLSYLSISEVFFALEVLELDEEAMSCNRLEAVRHERDIAIAELELAPRGATEAAISARLAEADGQLRPYLADPKLSAIGGAKGWKAVSVVFVGTESCSFRELGGQESTIAG